MREKKKKTENWEGKKRKVKQKCKRKSIDHFWLIFIPALTFHSLVWWLVVIVSDYQWAPVWDILHRLSVFHSLDLFGWSQPHTWLSGFIFCPETLSVTIQTRRQTNSKRCLTNNTQVIIIILPAFQIKIMSASFTIKCSYT